MRTSIYIFPSQMQAQFISSITYFGYYYFSWEKLY